ncbi:hypothetical protein TSUD_356450 [Trifolium subterraneum]|uniref:Uncharacterized protein n=1 Tax=Trifolium subterraneum TaxID=3900 RepID=A0A2Z6N749_TRISU|nr:hypothetical protein TSUD_356450 [Trifolium subterraneum]
MSERGEKGDHGHSRHGMGFATEMLVCAVGCAISLGHGGLTLLFEDGPYRDAIIVLPRLVQSNRGHN